MPEPFDLDGRASRRGEPEDAEGDAHAPAAPRSVAWNPTLVRDAGDGGWDGSSARVVATTAHFAFTVTKGTVTSFFVAPSYG